MNEPQYVTFRVSRDEIEALKFILDTILRGGQPTMVTRHRAFAALYRKVHSVAEAFKAPPLPPEPPPKPSLRLVPK